MNDFDGEAEYRRMNGERLDRIEALLEEQKEARRRTHETIESILIIGAVILISDTWGWAGLIVAGLGVWVLSWPWNRWASDWRETLREAAQPEHLPGVIVYIAYVSVVAFGLMTVLTTQ